MLIVSSAVSMSSAHLLRTTQVRSEKLQVWVGEAPPDQVQNDQGKGKKVDAGQGEQSSNPVQSQESDRHALDLAILMRTLGKSVEEVNQVLRGIAHFREGTSASPSLPPTAAPSSGAVANDRAGFGLIYDFHEELTEVEATDFVANGVVRTADGQAITFDVGLAMERVSSTTTDISIRAGDAVKVDPLVLNLTQAPPTFDGKQTFDLDGDGTPESIARLAAGSAYLALDSNGNGQVDSGQELFGPQSGNGFAELSAYDDDGNGWIDEGDAVFNRLKLWSPSNDSNPLTDLQRAGIGAIYLGSVSTPFSLKAGDTTNAVVARTGIYLKADGEVSTVQHVDLVV